MSSKLMKIDYLKLFKNNLVEFFDELINQFPNDSDFIIARIFIKDKIPIEDILNAYIVNATPHEDLLKERDSDKIIQIIRKMKLGISENKLIKYAEMWKVELDDEDKSVIWSWIDTFNNISKKYTMCE
jgi:hypothetical protein